ncbi:amino acid permease [candidate division CSSED10-310 bacterium]|uniref:Amino acid permease n=1 Tax=candidate division CSSED10-310 bacterium TaxID=2855610 RepID=A0ABV6Z2P6_UNCC1
MVGSNRKRGYGFGTAPVFLAAISTILGAVLFLRFGYAVAHTGLFGSIAIIVIGHAITIPTAFAIAEIATNLKVEGGGEYFIISRSFGSMIGGTIGISLYFSQAISVAFYMIAFAESFTPLFGWIQGKSGIIPQTWMFSVPATLILLLVIIKKGANIGVTVLWIVVSTMAVSLGMFFLGKSPSSTLEFDLFKKIENPHNFFMIFAIIFPAFTGMTAGVGLSGDLKNPRKSIPLGTLSATVVGMVVYFLVVFKLSISLTPEELAADQFAMSKIALWGPIIPIGLAAATLSSAIGSILIAPRTLQALANDHIFPILRVNDFIGRGKGESNEPVNATMFTALIVIAFVSLGSVDFVAQIISMFFMITYGTLCLVSFLEHFAGNPSYRPTFRSRWYLSLIGALSCFFMMFQMSPVYALFSIVAIVAIYASIKRGREGVGDLSALLQGVFFQLNRKLQVLIQRKKTYTELSLWRPSFIGISSSSVTRLAPFDLIRWISQYHGFGTYIHFTRGPLDEENKKLSVKMLERMIKLGVSSHSGVFVDTIVSPSFETAVAQIIQIPGVSGMENNSILFEFHEDDKDDIIDIIKGCRFAKVADFNICVLRSSERHFGFRKKIHMWLTPGDYRNANLIILLAYIISGHHEWRGSEIELFAAFERTELNKEVERLNTLIDQGRIPISHKNVQKIPWNKDEVNYENLVTGYSEDADLVMMGFSLEKLTDEKGDFFNRFGNIKDLLFVRAGQRIALIEEQKEN